MTQTQVHPAEEAAAAILPTSRIFVSGLPPTFTSEQLASHFGSRFEVTDAHVLADRRIGFVGFVDSAAAENAAKHFNRSYIRLSKINVDLAKPVELSRDRSGNTVPLSHPRPYSGSTELNRKRKRLQGDDGEASRAHRTTIRPHVEEGGEAAEEAAPTGEDQDDTDAAQPAPTDNDWLRGRTNRILDLVDPDELQIQQDDETEIPQVVAGHSTGGDAAAVPEQDEAQITKVPNARLFLRNLAFSVTDHDLRQRFKKFGKVQEVSKFS